MLFDVLKGYSLKEKNKETKIFFFHIPKCAGLSLSRSLRPSLPNRRIIGWSHKYHEKIINNPHFINDIKRKTNGNNLTIDSNIHQASQAYINNKDLYEKFQFLSGHLAYKFYTNNNNRLTLTILRDPILRSISNYNFWIEKGYISKTDSIENLFKKNIIKPNLITSFFSDEFSPNIDHAYKSLEEINIVSDTKDLSRLVNYLISLLDLPNIIFTKENITKNKVHISDKQMKYFIQYNELDIELYKKAKKLMFDFNKYENQPTRDMGLFSFYSKNKIFNNQESIIFGKEHLPIVEDTLSKY